MTVTKNTAAIGALVAVVAAIIIYGYFDPGTCQWMPRCTFKAVTGYDCPGCGSQRALHSLLHGDLAGAWHSNAFIFFLFPAGLLYFVIERYCRRGSRLYRRISSSAFLFVLLIATIIWWIGRNIA